MSDNLRMKPAEKSDNLRIRFAEKKDVPQMINLLLQVGNVHHDIRPDLFRMNAQKYDEKELLEILADPMKLIFAGVVDSASAGVGEAAVFGTGTDASADADCSSEIKCGDAKASNESECSSATTDHNANSDSDAEMRDAKASENDKSDRMVGYAFCIVQITQGDSVLRDCKVLYIDDLCVDASYRGRNIAKPIYDAVVAYARENNFDAVTLNVWEGNERARSFYEKCGLKVQKTGMELLLR